ncbi:MAG: TonB-dependent receptor [Bacteroidota bacterium]
MNTSRMRKSTIFVFIAFLFFPLFAAAQNFPDSLSSTYLKQFSLEELMDIEITSVSKKTEPWFKAPASVSVITNDDIRRSGASTIPEALRLTNSLNISQKGAHSWGISARGFNTDLANKLLVLIDGRTVYTPLYSGVFWGRQDYLLNDIARIEIINGPGSTLWGANAVNGVINIITKDAGDSQGLYTEIGGGTVLERFAGIRYGGMMSSSTHYRIYGKYARHSGEMFADGTDSPDSWRMGQGGFRIDANTSSKDLITFQGDIYSSEDDLIPNDKSTVSGENILGRWSHSYSEKSDLKLQLYVDRTHLYLPTAPFVIGTTEFAPAGTLKDDLDTYDLDFQHRFSAADDHAVIWGFGYRFTHDVVKNSPALGFFPERLDQNLFSGFVQDEISLTENVAFTLGTKVEHNDYTGWEFEPSTRLQWMLSTTHMFWGAISRAVRMPSRIDRDMSQPAPPYFLLPPNMELLVGGSDFKSETVIAYEAGYRTQVYPALTASISAFYNRYDDIRSTSLNAATTFPLFFENNLEGETYGFEFGASYRIRDWWMLHGGYNLLKEDIRVTPGKSDFNKALNETSDPQQQIMVNSVMNVFAAFEVSAKLRWVDILHNYNGSTAGSVPSYAEVDLWLGWHPSEQIALSVAGQNLLHPHHPEYGFPRATREEITRSVYGKLSWTL